MPDVGVLQLRISADASNASRSLKTLQTRLSEINQIAQTFNLSNVAAQIGSIVKQVSSDKATSTAVKNLGSLLNAIAAFSKVTKLGLNKSQIEQISALQSAVSGFNLGQSGTQLNKLREALGGEWNTDQAAKAKDALEMLSQGAKAITESGTARKIKEVSTSLEHMTGDAVGNVKEKTADIVDYQQVINEMGDTLKNAQVTFKEPRMSLNLQQFGGGASGFAETKTQIKEVTAAASEASKVIPKLMESLNKEINFKKGRLAESINNSLGISKPAMSEEAKQSTFGLWESQIQKLEEVTNTYDKLKSRLEADIDYSNIQKYMDIVTGVSAKMSEIDEKTVQVFNMPAMDTNGPFKYATDELTYYVEKLNTAKSDMAFWANEYESIQKRIKYNGATEERSNALAQAEQSFYAAVEAADEYKARLADINEYINKPMVQEQSVTELAETMEQSSEVVHGYTSIEEAAKSMGISVDEAKQKLQEAYNIAYGSSNGTNIFGSVEETAKSLGISVEEVNKQLQETYNMVYGMPKVSEAIAEASSTTTKLNDMTSNSSVGIMNEGILDVAESVGGYTARTEEAVAETKELSKSFSEVMVGAQGLDGAFKRMFPTISGLLGRFKQLVKYRMLRAIIKQIAEGFKEGTENYYHYSEAIGGTFAPAMDNATSALLQMKNSIGAAAAPVIQALIPYLQMAVNWFITAINYANQFFALLGGQTTWSRAVPQTAKAFDNVKKSAGGASAAMKDLLADWDELNIIQSESGGGGGGGGAAAMEDYLNMFEESSIFEDKIKGIVSFVKDNFDEILDIVKQIGAALLLWKVSSAIGGILGTLAGLTAAGLTAALVFEVSTLFTNEYLKTGDVGWLIADILSTAIGAFFGKKILDKVLGGAAGDIFIPLAFTLSAAATIKSYIEHTDVDAFSEKGLLTALTAALEGGVAAGYLAHIVGATLGESLLGGAVGALATFGIAIALKADAKVSAEGITPDSIKQQLVGIGSLGVSGAIAGAWLGSKFGVGAAAGAAGLSMLFMGLPIATFGVSVGVRAINESIDTGGITADVIRDNFIASGLVGTGLAIGTIAVAGGSVAGIVGVAGAAVTLAALFGIEAILSEKHMTVAWGDKDLTIDQVKAFVENEVFTVSPNTILSLIDPAIEVVTTSEAGLQATVDEVKLAAKKITFGINEEEALDDLKKKIFGDEASGTTGLIDQFKETAKNKQTLIETGFSLVPNVDKNGNVLNIVDESSEVWSMLTGHMDHLGEELSTHLFNAYNKKLTEDEREAELNTIAQLTRMMSNISEAIIKGEEWELAMQEFEGNVSELSRGSWDNIISYIDEYKADIQNATEKAYDEVTRQMAGQVRGLKARMNNALELAGGNENDEAYKQYKQEYEYWNGVLEGRREGRKAAIDLAMQEAMDDETISEMRRIILEKIEGTATETDFREGFRRAGIDTGMDGAIDQFFEGLFDETGNAQYGTKTKYKAFLSGLIENAFGVDADAILGLMDLGILRLADIIPEELMNSMAENILQNGGSPELVEAMKRFFSGDFEEGSKQEAAKAGKEIAETIKEEYLAAIQRGVGEDSEEMDQILGELVGKYGVKAVEDVLVEFEPEVQVENVLTEQVAEIKQAVATALQEAIAGGADDNQLDIIQGELVGKYGSDIVEEVLNEIESGMYDAELTELNVTQPVTLDVETESVNSDINEKLNEKLNEELQGASGGGGAPSNYANIGASVMQGINATFANMKNILPWMSGSSDVTVKETRDSGEEIGNTAEGTRQGTSEIVTGQNTMNGYMQQVAMSTAGMVDGQGTTNSYMAQMVSLLRTIASQGGGTAPAAQSVMGGMVAGALAAFEAVRG